MTLLLTETFFGNPKTEDKMPQFHPSLPVDMLIYQAAGRALMQQRVVTTVRTAGIISKDDSSPVNLRLVPVKAG